MKFNLRYFIVALFFLPAIQTVLAQQTLPGQFYRQYSGTTGKEVLITLNLVKVNDTVYGNYNYSAGPGVQIPFPESRMVSGKIGANGSFRLSEWPGDKGTQFRGKFDDDRNVTGTWMIPGGGKGVAVKLTAKVSEEGLAFTPRFSSSSRKIAAGSQSPRARVQMTLLLPDGKQGEPGADTLRKAIAGLFTGKKHEPGMTADKILEGVSTEFLTDYVTSNQSMYQEMPGASFEWVLLKYTHIIFNKGRKVSFGLLNYSFTGGAHGLETEIFRTIDLLSGKTVHTADLFRAGFEQELTRLLTSRLQQNLNLRAGNKLSESGYFKDEIRPSENFYLNDNGVGFWYNRYEIAPYAFGPTMVFLTWEELRPVLK